MNAERHPIDELIASADPQPETPADAELDAVWAEVSAVTVGAASLAQRRVRRGIALAAGVSATALLLTAGAVWVATRTGQNTEPWEIPMGGPGELYRFDGSDLPAQLEALAADIPFKDTAAREAAVAGQVADARRSAAGPDVVQASTGALRASLARSALCGWARSWIAASEAGDHDAAQTAASAIRGAGAWPAVLDVDPAPTAGIDGTPAGIGSSVFGGLPLIQSAIDRSDAAAVDDLLLQAGWCAMIEPHPDAVNGTGSPEQPGSSAGQNSAGDPTAAPTGR